MARKPTPEILALETIVAALTSEAPNELRLLDNEDFEGAIEQQQERDPDLELETWMLDDYPADDIVETDSYPRNAGMANGFTVLLKALRLPSGATIYLEGGEYAARGFLAVARRPFDVEVASRFGEIPALPTFFHVGDVLLEIDKHLGVIRPSGWIAEEIIGDGGGIDGAAEWIGECALSRAEGRLAAITEAIDEALEAEDIDEAEAEARHDELSAPPIWFWLLEDDELAGIADYPLPEPERTPPLDHTFHPWHKPTAMMFREPFDPSNLQHIVAAYLLVRERARDSGL